jgi:hypothetical protein
MEKEFIQYEQALALKELGFDEECFAYYSNEELVYSSHTNNYMQRFRYAAPLYQQAFRWFREKYSVHMTPSKFDETKWWVNWGTWSSRVFDTYEEAELECLKKLIEIVKTK